MTPEIHITQDRHSETASLTLHFPDGFAPFVMPVAYPPTDAVVAAALEIVRGRLGVTGRLLA